MIYGRKGLPEITGKSFLCDKRSYRSTRGVMQSVCKERFSKKNKNKRAPYKGDEVSGNKKTGNESRFSFLMRYFSVKNYAISKFFKILSKTPWNIFISVSDTPA